MSRPDDLDLAEARAAAAHARLDASTSALQSQLQPQVIAEALKKEVKQRQRPLIAGAVGIVAVAGAAAFVAGLLRRRRAARIADPAAHARPIAPSLKQPAEPPRVRQTPKGSRSPKRTQSPKRTKS